MDEKVAIGDGSDDPVDDRSTVLPRAAPPVSPTAAGSAVPEHPDDPDDLWGWAAREEEPTVVDISHCRVTAVLVTQNAARWLPETLTALAGLTRRPNRVIAIDNQSTDATLEVLQDAVQRHEIDAVHVGRHGYGFGDAIRSALDQDRAAVPAGAAEPDDDDWLWLLHDDAAPAPDALAQLLGHVVSDPAIDITGPKLLRPRRRRRPYQISEVGVSIAPSGRRHLGLDPGEIDQGQRDQPARRLAVSSCGMLVRRTVWDALGGFDPAIPGFRDGVELGWRAQLAGHTVITTPAAAMVHRQVGRAGLRPSGPGGSRPDKADRELGMLLVAAHAPRGLLPLVWLRLLLGCLLRSVGYLLGKVPGRSADELAAAWSFTRHPGRIRRMRQRFARTASTPRGEAVVQRLRPGRLSGIRAVADTLTAAISNRYVSVAGVEPESAGLDELTSDELSSVAAENTSSPWYSPIVITCVLSVVGCLVAARGLIGLGSLTSPYLLPVSTDLGRLWHSFLDAVPGAPGATTAPWTGLVAIASTLAVGRSEWLLTALLVGTVPLGLVSVYPLIRHAIEDRRIRLWTAVSYALLPVLIGGTNQGRLLLSVAAVLLPLLALAGRALVLRRPGRPEAWRGGWGAGLVLTMLGAFEPSLLVIALLVAVVAAVTVARQPRKIGRLAIAIGVPAVILSPWWPTVAAHWGRLLTGPDPALNGTPAPAAAWLFLIGHGTGPGLPPRWLGAIVFGTFWLVALVGLVRGHRRRAVITGWLVGLICLGTAVALTRLVVTVPPLGTQTRPDAGVYLLIGFGALILAGGVGLDGYTGDLARRSFSVFQPLAVLAAVVVALVSLAAAGWWVLEGAAGPIHRSKLDAIPPYVLDAQTGPAAVRTLAVDLHDGRADYSVVAGDQVRLGDPERGYAFGGSAQAQRQVADVVSRLVSGSGDTRVAADLADLGVNYLWVSGADADLRTRITNTPGLAAASGNDTGLVWQLSQPTARIRLVSGRQITPLDDRPDGVRVPAGSLQRTLRLGVPADPRWQATLDGRPLTPTRDGDWQQSFRLPSTGGVLRYQLRTPIPWLPIGQGVMLLIVIVLAAPAVRRPEVRDPMQTARRAATVGSEGRSPLDAGVITDDLSELTSTGGLATVSDGLTTSTGQGGRFSPATVATLRRGEPTEVPDSGREDDR